MSCLYLTPDPAALEVGQPGGCHRIAEPGRQGVEPLIFEVDRGTIEYRLPKTVDCYIFVPVVPSNILRKPITHTAGELIIAANLTATGKAPTVSRSIDPKLKVASSRLYTPPMLAPM